MDLKQKIEAARQLETSAWGVLAAAEMAMRPFKLKTENARTNWLSAHERLKALELVAKEEGVTV